MKIVLIGYGKMGKTIESIAIQRGHVITEIIDIDNKNKINQDLKNKCDVAIEFSNPESSKTNILNCLNNGISVVSGTTGWKLDESEFIELTKNQYGGEIIKKLCTHRTYSHNPFSTQTMRRGNS